jgi:hypothetical protein
LQDQQQCDYCLIDVAAARAASASRIGDVAPPKAIIDDSERHVMILTIWDADAETKVYWRSPDGNQV